MCRTQKNAGCRGVPVNALNMMSRRSTTLAAFKTVLRENSFMDWGLLCAEH